MSKIFKGDFIAKDHVGDIDFTEITGFADFEGWTGSAPALETIGDNAYFKGWTGSAQELRTIGGLAYFRGWTGSAPELETIGGNAYFEGWEGSAPALETIGGNAYFEGWEGSAPALETIGGFADFRDWEGSVPELRTIGGLAYFKGWTGSAPKLNNKYIFSSQIGSRDSICKFDKNEKKYYTGCFSGNFEELIAACINRYGEDSKHTRQYMDFVRQCEG